MKLIMVNVIENTQGFFWTQLVKTFFNKQMLVATSVKCKNIKILAFSFRLTMVSWSSGDMNKAK